MAGRQMTTLFTIGRQEHPVNTKKYGKAKLGLSWADTYYFAHPGLYLWVYKRHYRVLPLPKTRRRP